MKKFEQHLLNALGGQYSFRDSGVSIATELKVPWSDWRAVEKHEYIHVELVDMSVYGWFQRIMFTLKKAESVPPEHTKMYKRVSEEMLRHCFLVHEGIASFREILWYTAYTENAKEAIRNLPDCDQYSYREAFEIVSSFMPNDEAENPEMQSAYHAICDIVGTFLLDAPLAQHYIDFKLLDKEELKYINYEDPDSRLKELSKHGHIVTPILLEALDSVEKIIDNDLRTPKSSLSSAYWDFFNNLIRQIGDAVPNIPICDPDEKRRAYRDMIEKWKDQISYPYVSMISMEKISENDAKTFAADVTQQRVIHVVEFKVLDGEQMFGDYKNYSISSPTEYLGTLGIISNKKNIAFINCIYNLSNDKIPLGNDDYLPADSIGGTLFEIDRALLKSGLVQAAGGTYGEFLFRFSVLQSVEGGVISKFNVVQYLNLVNYQMLEDHGISIIEPCIIRVNKFDQFSSIINSVKCDFVACWQLENIEAFGYCSENKFYFYPVTLEQRLEIENILTSSGIYKDKTIILTLGTGQAISVDQMASLAFFGMGVMPKDFAGPTRTISFMTKTGGKKMKLISKLLGWLQKKIRVESPASSNKNIMGSKIEIKQYLKQSGYTDAGWKCGRCGNVYSLPEKIKAKNIQCIHCGFLIPNKRAGES